MSVLGIGVDVVHVPRIAVLLKRYPRRLPSRILSPQESVQWHLPPDPTFIAVRWAVKEAAYKALYPRHKPSWKELTYHGLTNEHKPVLLYRPVKCRATPMDIHVSVSHDGEYVFASVLVQSAREL
ncbi:4'-phosphopantetheinyl transferase superfamily [Mycena maculata]|uniref:4'-phosphopantetheinyl transferase superfamily n=1 Tax=Mycena maculata TaxID=230809 RepID=A0AAD7IM97_9AGAR|nr:4'-phosphopantetheinyl transferase superfamily [Mycena maculata]